MLLLLSGGVPPQFTEENNATRLEIFLRSVELERVTMFPL
jgi:hypothetical protein